MKTGKAKWVCNGSCVRDEGMGEGRGRGAGGGYPSAVAVYAVSRCDPATGFGLFMHPRGGRE